jgi:hypothetical protein
MNQIEEAYKLLQSQRAKYGPAIKRYEMSMMTLRLLEKQLGADNLLKLNDAISETLWGIPIVIDDEIPLNEVKPIYA